MKKLMKFYTTARKQGWQQAILRVADYIGQPYGIHPSSFTSSPIIGKDPTDYQEASINSQEVFDEIYKSNFWGSGESLSGVGSEINFTHTYRSHLVSIIQKYNIKSMFDSPCGDINWMGDVIDRTKIQYLGGDISPVAINIAKKRHPHLDVVPFDICNSVFPSADVWHCRDCLFHLSFVDIYKSLTNFVKSEIPFALITTHRSLWLRNLDIRTGAFRYLDLERAPIQLSRPLEYLRDYQGRRSFPRYVGLWSREQIAQALELERSAADLQEI